MSKWIKRFGRLSFSLLSFLILCGLAYQFVSTKLEEGYYPPLGKMVDVGGYNMHIISEGEGSPTVVFDSGMGCHSLDWLLVHPEVGKFTRVCCYDRAGNGWSDESPLERTSENIATELHTLLEKSGEKPPYILVGHSFGGPNMLLFANKYPDEVVGMVLVDSSHEDHLKNLPDWPQSYIEKVLIHPLGAKFFSLVGLTRLYINSPGSDMAVKTFPEDMRNIYLATTSTTKNVCTVTQEFQSFKKSLQQLRDTGGSIGEKPLIVITARKSLTSEEPRFPSEFSEKLAGIWSALQKDLVKRSTQSKQVIADSGHMVTREDPEVIIEAIREVFEKWESGQEKKLMSSE